MTDAAQTREELLALAGKRFEAVGSGSVEASLSMLIDEPVFDLYPLGLRLAGRTNVRAYYEYFLNHVAPMIRSESLTPFFADNAIGFEMDLEYRPSADDAETFRLLAIMPVEGDRFTGERLYADTRLFRLMFGGPIWPLLTPMGV